MIRRIKALRNKEESTKLKKEARQKYEEGLVHWVTYWRKNPHRFVEEYLGLKLFLFQKILIYLMFKNDIFTFIACRGINIPVPPNSNVRAIIW